MGGFCLYFTFEGGPLSLSPRVGPKLPAAWMLPSHRSERYPPCGHHEGWVRKPVTPDPDPQGCTLFWSRWPVGMMGSGADGGDKKWLDLAQPPITATTLGIGFRAAPLMGNMRLHFLIKLHLCLVYLGPFFLKVTF